MKIKTNKRLTGIERVIVERIKKEKFNYKAVQRKGYFYSHNVKVNDLKASYGVIGYVIYTDIASISVDLELNEVGVAYDKIKY